MKQLIGLICLIGMISGPVKAQNCKVLMSSIAGTYEKKTRLTDAERAQEQTVMKEISKTVTLMALVDIPGIMEIFMLATLNLVNDRVRALCII